MLTQLLTVSSQLRNPLTTGGRVLDVFMEVYAITVIATLAGAMGSFLQKRGEEIDAAKEGAAAAAAEQPDQPRRAAAQAGDDRAAGRGVGLRCQLDSFERFAPGAVLAQLDDLSAVEPEHMHLAHRRGRRWRVLGR